MTRPDEEAPNSFRPLRYELTSVEKAAMPALGKGNNWYRYVLSSGKARITGFHQGTRDEVTEYALGCAEDFNLRSETGKRTRALAYSKKR